MPALKILEVSRRTLPAQRTPTGVDVLVVLKADTGDGPCEYAAYIGCGDEEWVAEWGAKLSYGEARLHFPHIQREVYRT